MIVAQQGESVVKVQQLADDELQRLSVGQAATVQLSTSGGGLAAPIKAAVLEVTPGAFDGSTTSTAIFKTNWVAGQTPRIGTPVQVAVTTNQKQSALVVPKGALRQSGGYSSVEVQDNTMRRLVRVEVGIITATTA